MTPTAQAAQAIHTKALIHDLRTRHSLPRRNQKRRQTRAVPERMGRDCASIEVAAHALSLRSRCILHRQRMVSMTGGDGRMAERHADLMQISDDVAYAVDMRDAALLLVIHRE